MKGKDNEKNSSVSFLRNLKISVKTTIPLIILIVITVITGFGGILNSKNIMVASEEINNVHVANIYNLQQLNYEFESLKRILYAHCVADMPYIQRDLEAEISEKYASIEATLELIKPTITEPEMLELYEAFQNDYASFVDNFTEAINSSAQGFTKSATTLANNSLTLIGNRISETIGQMILLSQEAMGDKVSEQERTYKIAISNSIGASLGAAIVGVAVFIIIVLEITNPMKKASEKLNRIISDI